MDTLVLNSVDSTLTHCLIFWVHYRLDYQIDRLQESSEHLQSGIYLDPLPRLLPSGMTYYLIETSYIQPWFLEYYLVDDALFYHSRSLLGGNPVFFIIFPWPYPLLVISVVFLSEIQRISLSQAFTWIPIPDYCLRG